MTEIDRSETQHVRIAPWLIIGIWTFYGVVSVNQSVLWAQVNNRPIDWSQILGFTITLCTVWLLFTPVVIWAARRFPLGDAGWQRNLVAHVPLAIGLSLLDVRIDRWIAPHFGFERPGGYWSEWLWALDMNIFYYCVIVATVTAADYHHMYRDRQRTARALQTELVTARLETLKMQLQPHFLFNTLNAINALIHEDREAADHMVTRLADLLRLTLYETRQQVPLARELDFVTAYAEIQRMRFHNRLTVTVDVDSGVLGAQVPSLLLQPLIENAIRHGIAPRARPGHVWVRACREGAQLILEIEDDGVGVQNGVTSTSPQKGIGLRNTQARLQQLYPNEHTFSLESHEQRGTIVRVTLPYVEAPDPLELPDADAPPTLSAALTAG